MLQLKAAYFCVYIVWLTSWAASRPKVSFFISPAGEGPPPPLHIDCLQRARDTFRQKVPTGLIFHGGGGSCFSCLFLCDL